MNTRAERFLLLARALLMHVSDVVAKLLDAIC